MARKAANKTLEAAKAAPENYSVPAELNSRNLLRCNGLNPPPDVSEFAVGFDGWAGQAASSNDDTVGQTGGHTAGGCILDGKKKNKQIGD
eukprot:4963859-Alexandrium_andersonii.AAC.1